MERIRCKKCGSYLSQAQSEFGPMDEAQIVLTFKMIEGGLREQGKDRPLDNMGDFVCQGCGSDSFEIVQVSS